MDVFVALSDPTRRQILDQLRAGELPAGELVRAFPQLTQPAISRHLRVLRETGLVTMQRDEQRRIYALRPEGLLELDRWLAQYRSFWLSRLDALEEHLAARATAAASERDDDGNDSERG